MSGDRKIGRNKRFCDRYKLEGRRVKNKAKKRKRHQKRLLKHADKLLRRGKDG